MTGEPEGPAAGAFAPLPAGEICAPGAMPDAAEIDLSTAEEEGGEPAGAVAADEHATAEAVAAHDDPAAKAGGTGNGGRPPLLSATPEMLDRVREQAVRSPLKTEAAALFGVHPDTFAGFLLREPEAMQAWQEGAAERIHIQRLRAAQEAEARAAVPPLPAPPGPGECCPTCGQPVSGP